MLEAGITDGKELHPVHLWPQNAKMNIRQARRRFEKGGKFLINGDSPCTINDLPTGARVIIHGAGVKLQLLVQ